MRHSCGLGDKKKTMTEFSGSISNGRGCGVVKGTDSGDS
jgi:hypothetical protein